MKEELQRVIAQIKQSGKKAMPNLLQLFAREVMRTGPPENRKPVRNEDIFFAVGAVRL